MAASEFRIASWRPSLLHYAGALALGICLLMLMPVDRMLIGQNDFVHFYIGGTLFGIPTCILLRLILPSKGNWSAAFLNIPISSALLSMAHSTSPLLRCPTGRPTSSFSFSV